MSFYIVKNEIHRFLASKQPEVLAIKGDWGVGKTFSWNKILEEARSFDSIGFDKYSYVSLFGVDSLDAFKVHMFQQQVPRNMIGTEANLETLKSNTEDILESIGKKSTNLFQGNHFARSFTPALESVSFMSLNNTLICVDDLERKGKNLAIKDILGLVSLLKEQKNCKVVLILNDSAFEDPGFKLEYETYKEKVIDVELLLAPSSQECVEVALHPQSDIYKHLAEYVTALNIRNIRIIKKIEKLAQLLQEYLEPFEPDVTDQAMHGLVLFSWCFYIKDGSAPTMDYVMNIGNTMSGADEREFTDQERLWQSVLVEYGFQGVDEFDVQIAKAVEYGYFVKDAFLHEAEKINRQVIASKADASFKDAWKLYHESFDDNQDELIEGLFSAVKNHIGYISPADLNNVVKLFRDLGEGERADIIIDYYVENRQDDRYAFDFDQYQEERNVIDQTLMEKFSSVRGEKIDTRDLRQVLHDIEENNQFNHDDLQILARASVDDFYDLFKSEKGEHLNGWISICLRLGHMEGATDREVHISTTAVQALMGIASESSLNARRVAKFGIRM